MSADAIGMEDNHYDFLDSHALGKYDTKLQSPGNRIPSVHAGIERETPEVSQAAW